MPSEVQGWRAVALIGVVLALVAGTYLVPWGGGGEGGTPDVPTRGCAHARAEPDAERLARAERATLCLLNWERRSRGLRVLRVERRLRLAALRHSRDMVRRGYLEHDTPEGVPFDERILRAGFALGPRTVSGENLATGERENGSPAVIVDGWMGSPGHRRNLLRPQFRLVGIGIVPRWAEGDASGGTYTTDFAGEL